MVVCSTWVPFFSTIPTPSASHRQRTHNLPLVRCNIARSIKSKCGNLRRHVLGTAIAMAASVLGGLGAVEAAVSEDLVKEDTCEYTMARSGLGFCDIVLGAGRPIKKGMYVLVQHIGKLESGYVFENTYKQIHALTIRAGVGQVIKGWDEAILGSEDVPPMLPGGKRRILIPPRLGFADKGADCTSPGLCVIPPNSTLIFDLELIGRV